MNRNTIIPAQTAAELAEAANVGLRMLSHNEGLVCAGAHALKDRGLYRFCLYYSVLLIQHLLHWSSKRTCAHQQSGKVSTHLYRLLMRTGSRVV